ncbi:MAG: hypothetical protein K0R14_1932 [Burkholderiales bacterium]|jgi:L-lysine exporter family protein LysE/ArgO|nr:hypothetical protein [Burkholderiales bacterium]
MLEHVLTIFSGAIFGITIIAGIGPQSLNILTHAIKNNYPYLVAAICIIADGSLIILGSFSLGLGNSKLLFSLVNLFSIAFILWYISQKIRGLFRQFNQFNFNNKILNRSQSTLKALSLTLLNPLVFIDTVIIIGGNSLRYHGLARLDFILGTLIGDFIWLFGLVLVGRKFAYWLNKKLVWICIDVLTIAIMSIILYKIIE